MNTSLIHVFDIVTAFFVFLNNRKTIIFNVCIYIKRKPNFRKQTPRVLELNNIYTVLFIPVRIRPR